MKTYKFKFPKDNNSAKMYKEALMSRVVNAYPWLTAESKSDYPYSQDGIEYMRAGDYMTLGCSDKFDISWMPACAEENPLITGIIFNSTNRYNELYKFYEAHEIDLEKDFNSALRALNIYANNHKIDNLDYDFKDIFGEPVFIHDNFIQIGYEVIPIAFGSLNHLKPNKKKTIINITIKVKMNGLI